MTEQENRTSVGGNIDSAIKGEYHIDVKDVLSEAWQQTLTARASINIGLLMVFIFGVIVSYIASSLVGGIEVAFEDPALLQLINIIVTIAVWPFMAGVEMMGIKHAINKPSKADMVLGYLHRGSWVALCAVLTSVFVSIGLSLFFIPGVILAVLLSLTIPLVVEKEMSPMQAVVISIKALRFKLFSLLSIYSLLFSALVLSLTPVMLTLNSSLAPIGIIVFLFALSFLAPLFYNVKGILYREIFGIYVEPGDSVAQDTAQKSDDSFVA